MIPMTKLSLLFVAAVLTACGGGGNSGSNPPCGR